MTHARIAYVLELDGTLISEGKALAEEIEIFLKNRVKDKSLRYPYQRWVSLVIGRQLNKHAQSKGATHEIQLMLNLPDNILRE